MSTPSYTEGEGSPVGAAYLLGYAAGRDAGVERVLAQVEALVGVSCHHCGRLPEGDGDHTCLCPLPDSECLRHTVDPVVSLNALRALVATLREETER